MKCINLKEEFGQTYRVKVTSGYEKFRRDPWNFELLCQYGHIYPHGDDELGFASDKSGSVAQKVANLPFITVIQDGSDGKNIVFHVDHLEEILKIVKPRKRRQMSKEQRLAAIERLRKYRVTVNSI